MHILRTHLLENPDVVFYYNGTATEDGVPFALNTIVSFKPSSALVFYDEKTAMELCERLNLDKLELTKAGYSEYVIIPV